MLIKTGRAGFPAPPCDELLCYFLFFSFFIFCFFWAMPFIVDMTNLSPCSFCTLSIHGRELKLFVPSQFTVVGWSPATVFFKTTVVGCSFYFTLCKTTLVGWSPQLFSSKPRSWIAHFTSLCAKPRSWVARRR